jgi:ATP-binding cassette subfamily B protein
MNEKTKQSPREIIRNNWFLLKIALQEAPGMTLFSLLIPTFITITVYVEHVYMVAYIISSIEKQKPFINVAIFVVTVFLLIAFRFITNFYMDTKVSPKGTQKIFRRIRMELYEKARSMDLSCYDDPNFYNDYVWAMNNAPDRVWQVINTIGGFISAVAGIVVMGVYILTQNIPTIIAVTVSLIGVMVIDVFSRKLNFKLQNVLNPIFRKRDYTNRVFYLNDYAKEIRLSNVKEKLVNDYIETEREVQREYRKMNHKIATLEFVKEYIFGYSIMEFLYLLYLMFETIIRKTIDFGTMYGLYKTADYIKGSISSLASTLPQFSEHSLYIGKIKKFLEYKNTVTSDNVIEKVPENLKTIELKNVSFSYNENSAPVLRNVSMTINPGEKIALVGYNGAGKTTLVKMLMRFYDVSGGEIFYGGVNIKDYDINEYRDIFSTLFQDYQIFAATVEQNITVGNESVDEHKIYGVLEQSGLKERIEKMENGISTQLTNEFDEGVDLSGGERQKLAISRCLYQDSNIIILDEPSSALDPIAEYEFNNTMLNLSRDKTIIFISHRLSTTKMADRIYMFDDGNLIESGSHDELMATNGKYAEMFLLQAEKYR